MKYLPDCVLSVIFPLVCVGTIWQMPLIVSLLVPEGRYRYPEIRFLWIKKPQYIQYCPIVLLWSNNWIILFFLGSFPFFSLILLYIQEAKNCEPGPTEGLLTGPVISLLLSLAPLIFTDTLWLIPFVSLVVLWALFSFCVFVGPRPSCTCRFPLFWFTV